MIRVAIKGMLARKVRLLLTSVAIVLGVAFVSGAFFLTDSIRSTFEDIFSQATQGVDVEVRTVDYTELVKRRVTSPPGTVAVDLQRVGMPPEVLERIRGLRGVARAEGTIFEEGAQPLDKDGTPIGGQGPPSFAVGWVERADGFSPLHITSGRSPRSDEVMLDEHTRGVGKFRVGDPVDVLVQGGRKRERFTVSGFIRFGSLDTLNGATITVFETSTAQRLLDMGDRYSAIDVEAEDDVSPIALKRRINRLLPSTYAVITGEEVAAEQQAQIDSAFLDILQNVILGFAAIAVFVGAFTIFNTFTILVGQRTREFGLLRAIGASRRQVLGIVVLEALVLGLVASTVGLVSGYGVAWLLRLLINTSTEGAIPKAPFPLHTHTVAWSYAVGIVVTVVASVLPAWRAGRLSPLEAIRVGGGVGGRGWRLPVAGAVLVALGGAFVAAGFRAEHASTSTVLSQIGGGFALAIVGIALLSRIFIGPVTRVLSTVLARGTTGRLASRNVLRNRARSATTASALMIGLALASLVLVFYGSLGHSVDEQIDTALGADITVFKDGAQKGAVALVSDATVERIRGTRGVDEVAGQRTGGSMLGTTFDAADTSRDVENLAGFDPRALRSGGLIKLGAVHGSRDPRGGILVDDDFAQDEHVGVGDTVRLAFPTGQHRSLRVRGTFGPNKVVGAQLIVDMATFDAVEPPQQRASSIVYASVDDGRAPRTVVHAIERRLGEDTKFLQVKDTEGLRQQFRDQLKPILGLVLGMLLLSLIIALFGIGNTLALNVFERTREIGLLRAVGGTRNQLRLLITVEAVLVALFGAIVGVVVGVSAGRALIKALEDDGFVFSANVLGLVFVLLGGFVAGLIASVLPARRAARTDVLRAIAAE